MDTLEPTRRSFLMSRVLAKNTKPEVQVRRIIHSLGLRFRLHAKSLPGRPDIVMPRHRTVVFVHGCFWHRHVRCKKATTPSSNKEFWLTKFSANKLRDKRNSKKLKALGWKVVIIWECQIGDPARIEQQILRAVEQI